MDSGKRFFDPKEGKYSGHKDALFDSISTFFTSCTFLTRPTLCYAMILTVFVHRRRRSSECSARRGRKEAHEGFAHGLGRQPQVQGAPRQGSPQRHPPRAHREKWLHSYSSNRIHRRHDRRCDREPHASKRESPPERPRNRSVAFFAFKSNRFLTRFSSADIRNHFKVSPYDAIKDTSKHSFSLAFSAFVFRFPGRISRN